MWYKVITRVILSTLVMAMCAMSQPGRDRSSSSADVASSSSVAGPGAGGSTVVIRFMPNWTNTNAILNYKGTETPMTAVNNYCGWFQATVKNAPASGFEVLFKQTIGNTYVTAEGPEKVARDLQPVGTPINLDSVAALNDTLWIIGNPSDPLTCSRNTRTAWATARSRRSR